MTSYKKYFFIVSTVFLFGFFLVPHISHAGTRVYPEDVVSGAIWNKEGSPYILEDHIYVPQGSGLQIYPGVTIRSATSTFGDERNSLNIEGGLVVSGTESEPVVFESLGDIYFFKSELSLVHAVFKNTGLNIKRSTTTLHNVSITGAHKAISAKVSHIDIRDSEIVGNTYGIVSSPNMPGPFQVINSGQGEGWGEFGIGGIGNALEPLAGSIDPLQNKISIHNSVIENNQVASISNQTSNTIDARNNWWGSSEGPTMSGLLGPVETLPWKESDPREKVCCSSVIFLPGFQASRLVEKDNGLSTTLWEPRRNDDVRALYMDNSGKSTDPGILPGEIIDSAYMAEPIYKKFITMMNGVVTDGDIDAWLPLAYDWRKDVTEVVDENVIDRVEDLAATSHTGKVTIVAHSNGGLVAKELVRRLEQSGKGTLIEKMILVAVPELGTPQALLSMLHGDRQAIGLGTLLSGKNARAFSQNMPGAYGLIPSRDFFFKTTNPVIILDSNPITTYEGMKKFLTENPWSGTASSSTNIPMILKNSFLSLAESLHLSLDTWKPISPIQTISIAGWGLETGAGVSYVKTPHCAPKVQCPVKRSEILTERGDGTVLIESLALDKKDYSLFFNIKDFVEDTWHTISHANIFEATPILDVIKDQVAHVGEVSLPGYGKYFSNTEPVSSGKRLTLRFHSPVDVDIYTPDGRHTGLIPSPIPDSDLLWMENQIGVYVSGFGNEDGVKHVSMPYGPAYQIAVKGNGAGAVIIEAEIREDDTKIIASTTFLEMPVTPLTNIDLVIATSSNNLATGSLMYLDVDGDGTTDLIQRSAEALKASPTNVVADFAAYIEAMRKTIIVLKLPAKQEKMWLEKLDKILDKKLKKHPRRAEKIAKRLSTKRFKNKKLTEEQKAAILKVFESLATRLETETFTNIDR